jgi:hypothetical protein
MTKPEIRRWRAIKRSLKMKLNEWIVEVKDVNNNVIFTQLYEDFSEAQSMYLEMKEKTDTVLMRKSERQVLNG